MGTNYTYYEQPPCTHCGQTRGHGRHIGKSSGGWVFSLHIYPQNGIHDLDDWIPLWQMPGSYIQNEYGNPVTPDEMVKIVTERSWPARPKGQQDRPCRNPPIEGPNGLVRHTLDDRCLRHGAGTWDCIVGYEDDW